MPEKPEDKNKQAPAPASKPAGKLDGEDLDAGTAVAEGSADSPVAGEAGKGSKPAEGKSAEKQSLFARIRGWKYLYLLVFLFLLLFVGGLVGGSLMFGKNAQKDTTTQDLTAEQLADLAGTATVVGDAQEVLSIRSATVFESQLLAKKDMDVAGSLKVGGLFSIPTLQAGTGTLDKLQVNNDAAIAGSLAVQGSLTISGASSFQNLSVGTLSVSTLQLAGDLNINRHIVASGGAPGKTNGTALGGGGTASVSGSDTAGTIAINTGNSPPAGCFINVDFANDFNGNPAVVVTPIGSATGSLEYYVNRNASGFSVCTASAPAAGTNYAFDYIVIN